MVDSQRTMKTYVWCCAEMARLVRATTRYRAIRLILKERMKMGSEDTRDALRWFKRNDDLWEVSEEPPISEKES